MSTEQNRTEHVIRFIVHGGYGKTATTFLQEKIFCHLDDVLYFGKGENGKMFSDELQKLYYTLFPSLSDSASITRARNSSMLIPCIGDLLLREMKQAEKDIILLSNECLIDFGNYNAELNMLLLLRLFNYLQDNYNKQIEFKVMMTIRSQKDYLKSFYAYDFTHLKSRFSSFEKFIQYGVENKHDIVFGGCHYDLVLDDMKRIYGHDNVRFFVYEKMNEDINSYLQDIFQFIETDHRLDALNYKQKLNVNSKEGTHKIREVKRSPIAKLILGTYQYVKPRIQSLESTNIFQELKKTAQSYCNNSVKVIDRGSLGNFPHELASITDNMYRKSNNRLSQMLGIDLEKYGYVGGQRFTVENNHAQQGAAPDSNSAVLHYRR